MARPGSRGVLPDDSGAVIHRQLESDQSRNTNSRFDNPPNDDVVKNREIYVAERMASTWNKIQSLRDSVTRNRLELRERRAELRQDRAQARELEAQLWGSLQSRWSVAGVPDETVLEGLYSEVNKARDEIGPKEENYNELEDDYDVLEFKLEKKETRFYGRSHAHQHEIFKASFSDSSNESGQAWSRTSASEHTANSSSPSNKYFSKVGDANIIRERLFELEAERDHYLDDERERGALGRPLYQPNVDFLDKFPEVHARHLEQLRQIENDLDILRHEASIPDYELGRPFSSPASQDFPSKPTSLKEMPLSSISLQISSRRRSSDGDLCRYSTDTSTSRKYINQWILKMLENSRLERARHKAMLEEPKLDNAAWLSLVLEYWVKDPAAYSLHNSPRGDGSAYPVAADSAHPQAETSISKETSDIGAECVTELSIYRDQVGIEKVDPADPFVENPLRAPVYAPPVESNPFADEFRSEKVFQDLHD